MRPRPVSWRVVLGGAFLSALLALAAMAQDTDLVFQKAPEVLSPKKQLLLDIARAGSRLIAVGAAGVVIYSDDSGASWEQASVPVSATLTAVDFVDERRGWAVGHAGVILHSADGGASWILQHDGRDSSQALLAYASARRAQLEAELDALDADADTDPDVRYDAEYALEDAIFLEEDAQTAIDTGPADPLLDVRFIDEMRGFAAGAYGAFLRTIDGGETWTLSIGGLDNPDRFHYYSILPTSDQGLFLIGEAGLLFRSIDGGDVFSRYDGVYDGSLFGAVEVEGRVLAFGLRGNRFSYDAASDDWAPLGDSTGYSLYGGTVLDDGRVLLLGANGSLTERSPDGVDTQLLHPSRATLVSAVTAADGRVWMVGMAGLVNLAEAEAP